MCYTGIILNLGDGFLSVTKLFGNSIAPSCEYCSHNITPNAEPDCDIPADVNKSRAKPFARQLDADGKCPFFSYDPLLRKPKVLPPLQKYSKDDFSL